jgi:AraC family transcriptional regulator of adaptative response / DNA-3-methyladenine glycosylase II
MALDPEVCYAATRTRDARFDGRFFTAVTSTRVYCRPICAARKPRREHMRFFHCAAAAEAAGFRACRRCRPDAAPGSAPWAGTVSTVARALRLIDGGALDGAGVDALAARLGVGGRHLRRLFDEHLGASPQAVAQTRRAHFARRLLDETALPVTALAEAAGFRSLRRFHEVWRASFGAPPQALRRRRSGGPAATIALRLPAREPYDWDALLAFLAPRAVPGIEVITPERYRRALPEGTLSVRRAQGGLLLETTAPPAGLLALAARVRRLFDVDADPAAVAEVLARAGGPVARAVGARPGVRVPGAFEPFETAVRILLGQQVSVAAASTLAGRLVAMYGRPVARPEPGLTHTFPAPATLAAADLAPIGLPRARAEAIRGLAAAVASGALVLDGATALLGRPGIGPWTAGAIAMRVLGDPDGFPDGDLVLRRAAGGLGTPALRAAAEAWRPFRAYAAMHLWLAAA